MVEMTKTKEKKKIHRIDGKCAVEALSSALKNEEQEKKLDTGVPRGVPVAPSSQPEMGDHVVEEQRPEEETKVISCELHTQVFTHDPYAN
jgi:hypothetical protein